MSRLLILRTGPLATIQDEGRPGNLIHGVSASGPMDRAAYAQAQSLVGQPCGAAIEFSSLGLRFKYKGEGCTAGFSGGAFTLSVKGVPQTWPTALPLVDGDVVEVTTGPWGNYGYVRFDQQLDCQIVMGSRATNAVVGLGGFRGNALVEGDEIDLLPISKPSDQVGVAPKPFKPERLGDPIRFIWGLHADLFTEKVRSAFIASDFQVSARMDRMGVRLNDISGVFSDTTALSLVSDAVVPGDIQILGDGTPIILLRDHQPTGGYPRIATVITAELDRVAQIRPGKSIRFQPVTLEAAHSALKAYMQ